jgi:hypothetical protein
MRLVCRGSSLVLRRHTKACTLLDLTLERKSSNLACPINRSDIFGVLQALGLAQNNVTGDATVFGHPPSTSKYAFDRSARQDRLAL